MRPARLVAAEPGFQRLGLADMALATFGRRGRPFVMTVDVELTAELERRKHPFANLNHLVYSPDQLHW